MSNQYSNRMSIPRLIQEGRRLLEAKQEPEDWQHHVIKKLEADDEDKGHTTELSYEKLHRVTHLGEPVQPWNKHRLAAIRKAHDEGAREKLPPILVSMSKDGNMEIGDGIHRLSVARERKTPIKVKFHRSWGERN